MEVGVDVQGPKAVRYDRLSLSMGQINIPADGPEVISIVSGKMSRLDHCPDNRVLTPRGRLQQ